MEGEQGEGGRRRRLLHREDRAEVVQHVPHLQDGAGHGAHQTVTVAATGARAKALVGKLRSSVEDCLGKLKKEYPGLKGTSRYQGKVSVEEGAYVYSIDTADPKSGSDDIRLYSVGRDGKTVTVIGWGQLGDLDGAPLKGFKKTTRTAVAKLR